MSSSSTSHSTDSEVVVPRRFVEDENARPTFGHSANGDFLVGIEDADVMPVEEDPLKIRSSNDDEEPIRYFVFFLFFRSFIKFISILFQSKKKKKNPRSQVTRQSQAWDPRKPVATLHNEEKERSEDLPMQLMQTDVRQ